MLRLRELLPANRVAAIAAFLTSLAASLTSLAGAWGDERVVKAVGGAVGVIGSVLVVLKFLEGAQRHEGYQADPHMDVDAAGQVGNVFHPGDDPFAAPVEDEVVEDPPEGELEA